MPNRYIERAVSLVLELHQLTLSMVQLVVSFSARALSAFKCRHLWQQVGGKFNASALGSSSVLGLERFFKTLLANAGCIARKKLTNCSSRQLTVGIFGLN
ncbi:hypothetical protein ACP3V5_25455 [Vibrio maritimus]